MFKALTAIVALAASASVMAQSDVTLNSLAHDATTRIACGTIHPATDSNACALGLTALLSGMAIDARNGESVETLEHYAQAALALIG